MNAVAFRLDLALAALVLVTGVGAAAAWVASRSATAAREARDEARRSRLLQLMAMFAIARASIEDARVLLAWHPLAATARAAFPSEFAELDRLSGSTFPFGPDQIHAAHARWTAEWLAWELAHDAEYKLKAATLEDELGASKDSRLGRARLDAIEREKLARYQKRYEEYTRVSKALQTLTR